MKVVEGLSSRRYGGGERACLVSFSLFSCCLFPCMSGGVVKKERNGKGIGLRRTEGGKETF